jgi:diacylglycerol O-acyltransferase
MAADGWHRLSPLDAAFLYFERPTQRLHVGCVALLDGPVPFEPFAALLAERLGRLGRYRQRPVRPTFDLDWPSWEDDAAFDVRRHVRHVAVPPPGGEHELHELVDTLFSMPFDRRHPLWEFYLIEGLADGRAAVLSKVHHCMIDGVSGAQTLEVITDPAPDAPPATAAPSAGPTADNGRPGLAARALGAAAAAGAAASILISLARDPVPRLPFNGPLSDARRVAWTTFALDDVLAMRGAAGCKVNDVVLALIAGALRRYLADKAVAVDSLQVRTVTPVSMRQDHERLTLGNRVSAMFPRLPVALADPVARLRAVAAEMRTLKDQGAAQATGLLLALGGALPPAVGAVLGRLAPEQALVNTVCTNVPGPRDVRYLLGRRVFDIHPIVPLFMGMGVEFAILSYAGRLSIGVTFDPTLAPDAERLTDALAEAGAELRAALGPPQPAAGAPLPAGPRVADLMARDLVTIGQHASLAEAHRLMRARRIRHLPVVDGQERLVGLVTHGDLLAAATSSLVTPSEDDRLRLLGRARAYEVMETHLSTARPEEAAAEAGQRMVRHKIGCLPVVGAGATLVGIVTEEDYLRWATEHMGAAAG